MINIEHLTFKYSGATRPALQDICLSIKGGEFVLITGPSGGGKSSLCRCLNGLIPHFYGGQIAGKVEVGGLNTFEHRTRDLAQVVGMVFQDPENQLVTTDVEREVAFGLENLAFPRNLIARRVEEALDTLGISDLRDRPIHELSGGEKQKIAIASVLALHPDVLVLDEPTSELDPKGAEEVLGTIQRLNDELGITVILVEHRLDRVVHLVDRMIIAHNGKIIADGTPRNVLRNSDITSIGVGIPPIIRLALELEKSGQHLETIPLTVKEGRLMLSERFKDPRKPIQRTQTNHKGEPTLRVDKLWYSYSGQNVALKGISLTVHEGEFLAIMGRNAAGKTTLAKHIIGLLKPTKGKVIVKGADTRDVTTTELAKQVGIAFQNPNDHLFADTVQEEVSITLRNLGFNSAAAASRINEVLELFNLHEHRHCYPRSLSGGERQRVALASVVAARPKILILDEPTRGMEYKLKSDLMFFLNEYRSHGNTVILISHDVETVAAHADRVVLLSDGRLVVDGPVRDVLSNALLFSPQINRLVQSFVRFEVPQDIMTTEEALDILK